MTAVTTIYRSKIHSSFRRRKCNIPSSSVISRRNAVSAQIYTTREKRRLALPGGPEPAAGPPSSRRGLGAHRSRCPPGPRSARGQFSSPFLLKRDSNQTTPSAEEGEATPWTGHTPTPWRPRGRPAACPHGPRALREDLLGGGVPRCALNLHGATRAGPAVWQPKPRFTAGSASIVTEGRPAGSRQQHGRSWWVPRAPSDLTDWVGGVLHQAGRLGPPEALPRPRSMALRSPGKRGGRERCHRVSPKPAN